jgi:hypothetical protein
MERSSIIAQWGSSGWVPAATEGTHKERGGDGDDREGKPPIVQSG